MRRRCVLALATAVAVAGAMVVSLSPSDGSAARWRDSATAPAVGPTSGTFGMTANDAAGDTPRIDLTNESTHPSSWINVRSVRLDKVVPNDSNAILKKAKIDYRYGEGSCGSATSPLWQASAFGQLAESTTQLRAPQTKVAGATLGPGQKRVLCPVVGLDYSGEDAQRDALLNHAGRAIDITTVVNQRSEAPATWASHDRTVTSRYRVDMPAPTTPSDIDVCQSTKGDGEPKPGKREWGGFFWGWPDATTSKHTTATPAMRGDWQILRLSPTGGWRPWQSQVDSGDRHLAGIDSSKISDDGLSKNAERKFKLRGFPFASDRTRYVESQWIVRASAQGKHWVCGDQTVNPDAGPHNIP